MEGNQMKMRETLLVVRDSLDTISAHEDDIEFVRTWIRQTKDAVQEALSLPPRNCDVGTAEEQAERMDAYCARYGERIGCSWRCDNCPLCSIDRCELVWAQMPYEAEEGAAK